MSNLKRILRELTQEIDRLSEHNEMLERRLSSITGALRGTVRSPRNGSGRARPLMSVPAGNWWRPSATQPTPASTR